MPVKKMVLVRRKKGLSPEEFRNGYENSHSRIAVRLFGHLWLSYTRNYLFPGRNFKSAQYDGVDAMGFDAIAEFVLRDEAAWDEMNRIAAENNDLIKEDEARWFDQVHCWLADCDPVVEDFSAKGKA
jgi:hypothetical protein